MLIFYLYFLIPQEGEYTINRILLNLHLRQELEKIFQLRLNPIRVRQLIPSEKTIVGVKQLNFEVSIEGVTVPDELCKSNEELLSEDGFGDCKDVKGIPKICTFCSVIYLRKLKIMNLYSLLWRLRRRYHRSEHARS